MNKTLIISMHPAPYRDPVLYSLLEKYKNIDIVYLYDFDKGHTEWNIKRVNVIRLKCYKLPIIGDIHFGLIKLLKKYSYVLIPGWYPTTLLIALFYSISHKKKVIFSCDTINCRDNIIHKVIFSKLRKCHSFYVPGDRTKQFLINTIGISSEKIFQGSYMLDERSWNDNVNKFKNLKNYIRSENAIPESAFVYLFVGKLVRNRNVPLLIEAFKKLNDKSSFLIVIGDGLLYKKEIENGIINTDKRIVYIPKVNFEELAKYYAISDCYVHPGKEPYSLATVQAVIAGLSVVSNYNVGCIDDYLRNEFNGIIINTNSCEELQNAMDRVKCLDFKNIKEAQTYALNVRNKKWALEQLESALSMENDDL